MGDIKRLLILLILLVMLSSQSLLSCSGHGDEEAGLTRKLGVFIKKRARFGRPTTTTRSASAPSSSGSFHMIACLATSFLLVFLF
ncbi:PREDICTED: uncharacterized protein LOC109130542 [Camelina sativa]|uniref:Uncharacterized protein LOC109130542 n=1 Tax=Camelina sativa TaxID=90675 RepID=A0ABM1R9Q7_CAMSA|nr:PREDICTED: uncharacterized protein LOC109130542 [Camelina sativa]